MSISVTQLSKKYGTQIAVNHISFSLKKGEIVGFLGPNGAGKSTTMKMITGYLQPDEGNMLVCNIPVKENHTDTKSKIGYLPEANPLYVDMFAKEYLYFIAGIHQIENREKRIKEVVDMVGLSMEAHKKIGQLSKGYKQRVGLAAALVHDPEVLILDEPTSGLDPNQIVEIRQLIKKLGEQKTVLFSSHIMQEVEAICERVIIINKGTIVADDALNVLRSGNLNKHIVAVQFKEAISLSSLKERIVCVRIDSMPDNYFIIETTDAALTRKQLLELSLKNNWNILSLNSEKQNLETIFKNFTL